MPPSSNPRGIRTDVGSYAKAVSATNGFVQSLLAGPDQGGAIRVVKNLMVGISADPGLFSADATQVLWIEHGFLRYPSGETVTMTDIDVSSRYVLRAKISPYTSSTGSPYTVLTNFLKAINLTPDDELYYYMRPVVGSFVQNKGILLVYKDAGYIR